MSLFLSKNRLYVITFLVLMLYWWLFLHSNRPLVTLDWYAIASWLDVWKVAFKNNQIPYYVNMFEGENLWGTNYFAMPYIIASPHIILLSFLSIKSFIYIHVLVSTFIGYIGIIKFRQHFDLSATSFLTMVVFFFFGGFWTDRISVGHIQNAFYLAIPAFLWILYRFFTRPPNFRSTLLFALFLFAGLLQGSLHVVHQFIFVLLIFSLFQPKHLLHAFLIVILFVILSAYFFVPNLLFSTYSNEVRKVFGGYGYASGDSMPFIVQNAFLVKTHINFLIAVVSHFLFAFFRPYSPGSDAVWEYSIFASPFILYYIFLCRKEIKGFFKITGLRKILPVLILIGLSIGYGMPLLFMVIEKISFNKFPVIDRLPSRIFIYPFSIIVLYSIITKDKLIRNWQLTLSILYVMVNSYIWRVDHTLQEKLVDSKLKTEILSPGQIHFDPAYISAVNYAYFFSALMVLLAVVYLLLSRPKQKSGRYAV